jgi:hypothetical protein
MLNLVRNAIDAMDSITDRARVLRVPVTGSCAIKIYGGGSPPASSSFWMSRARYGGTGAARESYWSLNDLPIALSATYRSRAPLTLLGVAAR